MNSDTNKAISKLRCKWREDNMGGMYSISKRRKNEVMYDRLKILELCNELIR